VFNAFSKKHFNLVGWVTVTFRTPFAIYFQKQTSFVCSGYDKLLVRRAPSAGAAEFANRHEPPKTRLRHNRLRGGLVFLSNTVANALTLTQSSVWRNNTT
jgi:hypothetical protein